MTGSFGSAPTDDGMVAFTQSNSKVGVFGRNQAAEAPSNGGAGGSGVFGFTVAPGGAGVFGACENNAQNRGVGVQGNGPEAGLSGFSTKGVGVRAHSDHGDGVFGATRSSSKVGLFGRNDAPEAPSGGGAGGSGVFGFTVAPGGAGVFGACENNAQNRGVGVQGNGPEAGLSGFSIKGVGVRAHSDHGDAVHAFAHDSAHNGILGHNNATGRAPKSDSPVGNGVFGFTEVPNANGVCGAVALNNTEGAGVCGIGPMAGRFVGNVAVTGTLNVQNVNVLQRISELEQKVNVAPQLQAQVQRLSDQVRSLQDQVNSLAANLTERVTRSEFEIAGLKQFSHSHA